MFLVLPSISFVIAIISTYLVREFATRRGYVSIPREDRWNRKSIALLGGVAIFVTMTVNWLLIGHLDGMHSLVMATSTLLFLAGLVDDFANLRPYQKLIAQLVAVSIFAASGLVLPWTPYVWVNTAITFVWLIGVTNAVNLLDNMDGLAAGISAIAGCFLAKLFYDVGQMNEAIITLSFSAALAGFLVFNWNPASIFMGDCGSMLLGFFLGGMSLLYVAGGRFRSFVPVIAVPVLILLIPIFDTIFVSVSRKLSGRSISAGGQDHTSHRLVKLGIPEKQAVLLFYGLATLSGLMGLFVTQLPLIQSAIILLAAVICITLLGVYIAQVKVYDEVEVRAARDQPVVGFLFNVSQKQPVFEVTLDTLLAVIAFQTATVYHYPEGIFLPQAMLIAIALKLPVFLVSGLYREIWRFVSLNGAMVIVRSVGLSAAALATVSSLAKLNLPWSMIGFDACLMFLLILGSRISSRAIRQVIYRLLRHSDKETTVIFGAGDAGELLCRELLQNVNGLFQPLCFLDDNPLKSGRTIHGLPVYMTEKLEYVLSRTKAKHLIISTKVASNERIQNLRNECDLLGVDVHFLDFQIRGDRWVCSNEENSSEFGPEKLVSRWQ